MTAIQTSQAPLETVALTSSADRCAASCYCRPTPATTPPAGSGMARSTAVRPASPVARAWPTWSWRCASRASATWISPTGRRPQRGRHRGVRRGGRHRPLGDAGRVGRPRRPHGLGAGRRSLGRRRPRDAGPRSGHHRRHHWPHRRRRAHPRRAGIPRAQHGLAVDNLLAAEVVTDSTARRSASESLPRRDSAFASSARRISSARARSDAIAGTTSSDACQVRNCSASPATIARPAPPRAGASRATRQRPLRGRRCRRGSNRRAR